jgi:hypothetical protein
MFRMGFPPFSPEGKSYNSRNVVATMEPLTPNYEALRFPTKPGACKFGKHNGVGKLMFQKPYGF